MAKPGLVLPIQKERKPFKSADFVDLETTPLETADKSLVVKIERAGLNGSWKATVKRGKGYSSFYYNSQGRYLIDEPHPLDLYFKKK